MERLRMQRIFLLLVFSIGIVFIFTLWGLWRTGKLSPYPGISGVPRSESWGNHIPHNVLRRDVGYRKQASPNKLKQSDHGNDGRVPKYKGLKKIVKLSDHGKFTKQSLSLPQPGNDGNGMVIHMGQDEVRQREVTTPSNTDRPPNARVHTQSFSDKRTIVKIIDKGKKSTNRTKSSQTLRASMGQHGREPHRNTYSGSTLSYGQSLYEKRSTTERIEYIHKADLSVRRRKSHSTLEESKGLIKGARKATKVSTNGTISEQLYKGNVNSFVNKSTGQKVKPQSLKSRGARFNLEKRKLNGVANKTAIERKDVVERLKKSANGTTSDKVDQGKTSSLTNTFTAGEKKRQSLKSRGAGFNLVNKKLDRVANETVKGETNDYIQNSLGQSGNDTALNKIDNGNDTALNKIDNGNDTALNKLDNGNDTALDKLDKGNDTALDKHEDENKTDSVNKPVGEEHRQQLGLHREDNKLGMVANKRTNEKRNTYSGNRSNQSGNGTDSDTLDRKNTSNLNDISAGMKIKTAKLKLSRNWPRT